MEKVLQVGVITSTHGIGGEVKVFPTTDDPKRFLCLKQVLLDTGKERKLLDIERVRFFKQFVILKFRGMDSINEVEGLRRMPLLVTREHAVPLEENEYFIADLEGMQVYTEEAYLGVLDQVMQTGANDVYVVRMENGKEILIPAIRSCILSVDVEQGKMTVHLLEGLVDL